MAPRERLRAVGRPPQPHRRRGEGVQCSGDEWATQLREHEQGYTGTIGVCLMWVADNSVGGKYIIIKTKINNVLTTFIKDSEVHENQKCYFDTDGSQ